MAGKAAAVALAREAHESGAHAYLLDVYGPGVFYRAFADEAAARAFAAEPSLDDNLITYSTDERVGMCGAVAVGLLTLHARSTIAVVDVVGAKQRVTVRRDAEPIVERIELVPAPPELAIERLPEPVAEDDETCKRVEAALKRLFEREGANDDSRRVYYIDARVDDLDDATGFESIADETFSDTLRSVAHLVDDADSRALTTPLTLRHLQELQASHDPRTHTVAWLKMNDDIDVVWLVERRMHVTKPAAAAPPAVLSE